MVNKSIAIIPARLGSKGFPGKNTNFFNGKPLVSWTIEAALLSDSFSKIVVSSDDEAVLEIADSFGDIVKAYKRRRSLSHDRVPGIAVALDAIGNEKESYEFGLFLQPTSPLRTSDDIKAILRLAQQQNYKSVVSITEATKSPNWMYFFDRNSHKVEKYEKENALIPLRQNTKSLYHLNGALYLFQIAWLLKSREFITDVTRGYIMPGYKSVDIDSKSDFLLAELISSKLNIFENL